MRAAAIATVPKHTAIARPIKVLVPLIKNALNDADTAGLEYYQQAGIMLLEARDQVAAFKWAKWLSKNFTLSQATASRYMRLAIAMEDGEDFATMEEALGEAEPRRARAAAARKTKAAIDGVDADRLGQERQTAADEIRLHRDLALELIDIGFKSLATRLHPDRGGTRDGMRRLNRVRVELNSIAKRRRFI